MSKCIECLHYNVCTFGKCDIISGCPFYKDRSEWVHLPYKLGETVWFITGIHNSLIKDAKVENFSVDELGVSYIGVRTADDIYFKRDTNEFYSSIEEAEKYQGI